MLENRLPRTCHVRQRLSRLNNKHGCDLAHLVALAAGRALQRNAFKSANKP